MKKLVLQSTLNHKQSSYEPLTVEVEKVITLYGNEFHKLMRETLMDNSYIKNNRELMYFDGDTAHCILFVDNETGNGMLAEAQGYGYARESQFIPEARGILESHELTAAEWKIHEAIKSAADRIAEQAHSGSSQFTADELWNSLKINISDLLLDALTATLREREDIQSAERLPITVPYQADIMVTAKPMVESGTRICVCKKDIRDDISKLLFAPNRTTILTLATIADKQDGTPAEKCAYYLNSIGFPTNGVVSEPKKSPFDYNRNAALFCSKALPYPTQENREEYRAQSIDEIVKLLNVTHGKTLILFTAKTDMEYVYMKLCNMILPYKILMQSSGSSQVHRLESFTNDVNSVILGCGTFWEGINVEGESLSQVIIFKLPFPVPEPILEYKMSLSKNPIVEVAVPEMILKLKQGAGRLIRSSADTGIVSILDPRASGKYTGEIYASLPEMQPAEDLDEVQRIWNKISKAKEVA